MEPLQVLPSDIRLSNKGKLAFEESKTRCTLPLDTDNCTRPNYCLSLSCQEKVLFVGGIKGYFTKKLIEKYFSKFGKVLDIKMVKKGYKCKGGFCFITFEDEQSIKDCISSRYHIICKTRVEAKCYQEDKAFKRKREAAKSLYERMVETLHSTDSSILFDRYASYFFTKN